MTALRAGGCGRFVACLLVMVGCSSPSVRTQPFDAALDLGAEVLDAPAIDADQAADAPATETAVDVPAGPSTCGGALALTPGVMAFANHVGSLDRDPGCGAAPGRAVTWYRVDAAAGTPMRVAVSGLGLAGNAGIRVLADCGAEACLAIGGSPIEATTVAALFVMPASGRAVISVAGGRPGADYSYGIEVRPLGARAPDRCGSAVALVDGTVLAGQTTFGSAGSTPACGAAAIVDAPAAWYAAEVPPGSTLSVSVLGRAALRFFDACDATRCLASATPLPGYGTLSWTNASASPVGVRVAVHGFASYDPAVFTLRAALTRTPATPSCSAPLPARDGFALTDLGPSTSPDRAIPCGAATAATPVSSYAIEVPAASTLRVSAYGTGSAPPFVRIAAGCADAACLAPDRPEHNRTEAQWTSAAASPRTVVVQVGLRASSADDRVGLAFEVRPVPANATCAGARPLADGARVEGESSFDHRLASPSACASGTRFYSVRVGAGEELLARTLRVGPPWGSAPGMSLAGECAAATCLAVSIATSYGTGAQQLSWANRSGAARDVVLAVYGDPRETPSGAFDLSVHVRPPAYALTRIPSACDPTEGDTAIPSASFGPMPMPIAFRYFGDAATWWTPGFDGTLRLWIGPPGGLSSQTMPTALPSTFVPSRTIAPFWDRFHVDSSTPMSWRLVDGASRHLTVTWPSFRLVDTDERVTFQVKLFEAGGVIEFHYCDVRGGTRANGRTASIGLQGATGLEGVGVAFQMASVDATTAFRFTPAE